MIVTETLLKTIPIMCQLPQLQVANEQNQNNGDEKVAATCVLRKPIGSL